MNMNDYYKIDTTKKAFRIPIEGYIDITYRCNNRCRHCWLSIPPSSSEAKDELSLEEIKAIINEARAMGCRKWSISGGEPMLRDDFAEIFEYITSKSIGYSLNTNGTLITPEIARLLKKKGTKMISLYGATEEIHDYITRNPGSFEATMRGMQYMKEAGSGFIVQIVPMKSNIHQLDEMNRLAQSLSNHSRHGASWLYLSAYGDARRNEEIKKQRLDPKKIVEMECPDPRYEERMASDETHEYKGSGEDGCLFASCINNKNDFYIDPYGQMSFCCFVKLPELRYELRKGSFRQGWDEFLPSIAGKVKGTEVYQKNCGACDLRADCKWCPVYGFLEHGDFSAKVDYLCAIAEENKMFKENWRKSHRRYYQIAGITIQVDSDLPITDSTFNLRFKHFEISEPGDDKIVINHHFSLPDKDRLNLGKEIYRKSPWVIYRRGNSWIYAGILPTSEDDDFYRIVVFNNDHTTAEIYNKDAEIFQKGNLHSLAMFPTDQVIVARILADREAFYMHSGGVSLDNKGLVFVGHSEAGKSTMMKKLKGRAEILCDDRIIIRRWPEGFKIHGTWSHGELPDISSASAPLKAVLFLEKSEENTLIPVEDKKDSINRLVACVIKPFVTADWWVKVLDTIGKLVDEVPCYIVRSDKSNQIVSLLEKL